MPAFTRLLQGAGFAVGLCLAALAAGQLVVLTLGGIAPDTRNMLLQMAGVLLLFATPLLAWPYCPRVTRWSAGFALCALAAFVCFQVFRSPNAGPMVRSSAIAFCLLALARVALAWRRSRHATAPDPL